jgi:MASE9 protein
VEAADKTPESCKTAMGPQGLRENFVSLQSGFKTLPVAARYIITMFGLAGFAAMLYAIWSGPALAPGRVIVLLALAAATARAKVNLYRWSSISFLTAVIMIAVMREGPAVAMLAGVCGVIVQTVFPSRKFALYNLVFNGGMIALTVGATFGTYHLLAGIRTMETLPAEVAATVLSTFVYFLGNSIPVSLMIAVTRRMSMFKIWTQHFMWSAPSFLIAGILALVVNGLTGSHFLLIASAAAAFAGLAYYCSIRFTAKASEASIKAGISTAA